MRGTVIGALVATALVVPGPATASEADSFSGSCQLTGTVTFSPALTLVAHPGTGVAEARGTCTGTVRSDGRTMQVDRAPASYAARNADRAMSCLGGKAVGAGHLTIGDHRFDFELTETRVAAISLLQLRGTGLVAVANVEARAGLESATACASAGLTQAPISIVVAAPLSTLAG